MSYQVKDIFNQSLSVIGVRAIDETPNSSTMATCLITANMMLGKWAAQRLLLRSTTPLTIPLTASKSTYTIGASGADVTASKPIKIISAYLSDSSNTEYIVDVISQFDYNNISDKTSTGVPQWISYDPGVSQQAVQTGTVSVFYTPDTSYTLHCETDGYLTEFVNLTDTVTFEPIYYEALVYNLAVRLWRLFYGPTSVIPDDIVSLSKNSLDLIKTVNSQPFRTSMDVPTSGSSGKYDILSDEGI